VFGSALHEDLAVGRPVLIPDAAEDPRVEFDIVEAFAALILCAYIAVPLIKSGRYIANMAAAQTAPRDWTRYELELLEEMAERAWSAMERARAEAALSKSERQYRSLVAATSDVVYRMSPDWSEMRYLIGRDFIADTADPSRTWLEKYIHPDDQLLVMEAIKAAIQAKSIKSIFDLEHRVRRVDGSLDWTHSRAIPLFEADGELIEWIGAASDVTDRVLAQEALRKSEKRLEAIFSGAYEYIGILSPNGTLLETNRASLEFGPSAREDVVGRPLWETVWFVSTPGAPEKLREAIARAAAGEFIRYEVPLVHPSGDTITLDFSLRPVRDEDGKVIFIVPEGRDITERKQMEIALADASRAKDEFLAMLSHDLRNPLSPIITALELMRLRAPEMLIKERTIIESQVRHLTELIDDLLDVSRIASKKIELEKAPVNIGEIITKALEMTGPLLKTHGQTVQTAVEDGLIIEGDARRLVQVITNLLTNAAKYSPPQRAVHISAAVEQGEAVVRIRDQGFGIEPKLLPHIFELFAQDAQSMERSKGGLGLGLAIVHNLVALHGGTVSAASKGLDCGSEFVVRLPLLARQLTAADSEF
jgi:PAS domain S-box-containing protein